MIDKLKKLNLGKSIIGAYSKNGWITSELMIKFMSESILLYTKGNLCALSLDDYHAHWTQEVMNFAEEKKIELIRVPPGITGDYQSLDVRINGILKMHQVKQQRMERIANPSRKFNLSDAVRYFKSGWAKIGKREIASSWKPMNF